MKFFAYFVLIALLANFAHAQEFIVKSVVIVPRDASRPDNQTIQKFKNMVVDTQQFYKKQMERYGYGSKTFRLETDREGNPIVEVIKSKYSKNDHLKRLVDYANDFPVGNRVYIVLIADINLVGGYHGRGRIVLDWTCAGCKGYAYIADKNGNFQFSTVAHELGHAFGLRHNLKGKDGDKTYLMWTGQERLDKDEARWLNKSPYFNRGFTANNPPRTTKVHKFEAFNRGGTDFIRLKVDMVGVNALYQAQAFRDVDGCVVAWDTLSGRNDTAEFIIPKLDLFEDNKVFIQFIDSRGNQHLHDHPLTIPLDLEVTQNIRQTTKNEIADTNRTETYLTLKSDSPDALTPTNYSKEWGWNWGGWQATWEKLPNKPIPKEPHQGFMPAKWIPYVNQWDYWFYAHVPSRIVYDLSGGNYAKFDAYLDIPHLCGNTASVQAVFFADDIEVYKSPILKGERGRNTHVSFDIPKNTESLTIKVTDAGDGGACDHFIFANARLLHGHGSVVESVVSSQQSENRNQNVTSVEDDTSITDGNFVSGKITGPWLWMIAPTKTGQGGAPSTDVDSLAIASGGAVTEEMIAENGANEGDVVGTLEWTLGDISEFPDNINEVVNKIGLGVGDVDDHSSYALITLESDIDQSHVIMQVGSDDSIKVWLNGEVVHKNAVDRGASGFDDAFLVNLIAGENLLLVKVSERGGTWAMFVGIQANVRLRMPTVKQVAEVDVNQDGIVNTLDLVIIAANYGSHNATAQQGDVNGDGVVDLKDFILVASAIDNANRTHAAPSWQSLAPKKTTLLPNYPNPCNPETWIPYQLAHDANVRIEIYAVDGRLIRTLPIGFQEAGVYINKAKAGYWDGRNEIGEPVASGLYFYTLFAGDVIQTQKIYVRK